MHFRTRVRGFWGPDPTPLAPTCVVQSSAFRGSGIRGCVSEALRRVLRVAFLSSRIRVRFTSRWRSKSLSSNRVEHAFSRNSRGTKRGFHAIMGGGGGCGNSLKLMNRSSDKRLTSWYDEYQSMMS